MAVVKPTPVPLVEAEAPKWDFEAKDMMIQLFLQGFRTDFTLHLFSEWHPIPVHKVFLMMRSKFFYNKLKGDMTNKPFLVKRIAKDYNGDKAPYIMMIKYFYTGESLVETLPHFSEIFTLMRMAVEYEAPGLIKQCRTTLIDRMKDAHMAINTHEFAIDIKDSELREACLKFICAKGNAMLDTNKPGFGFLSFTEDEIVEILERDDLQVKDEMQVFEAIYSWGKKQCRMKGYGESDPEAIRKQIAKLLKCVRFPLMKSEDFIFKIMDTKILKEEEEIEVLRYFALDESRRNSLPPLGFSAVPRVAFEGEEPTPALPSTSSQKNDEKPAIIAEQPKPEKEREQIFAAERILDKRVTHGRVEYLMQWRNWGPEYNSWEIEDNNLDPKLIQDFEHRQSQKASSSGVQGK